MAKYHLLTFDVYSALFDIRTTLVPVLNQAVQGELSNKIDALLQMWRAKQLEYAWHSMALQKGHLSFAKATRIALDYSLKCFSLNLSEDKRTELVKAWDCLEPWPEVRDTLYSAKQRGYKIAFLSNGDPEMLKALAERLPIDLDYIFSAKQAGVYKPHPNIYWLPLNELDLGPEHMLHVAGGYNDVLGAVSAGLTCAWVNRSRDVPVNPAIAPGYEFLDLRELLNII